MSDISQLVACGFVGLAKPLSSRDVSDVAALLLKCDPINLQAVLDVETSGAGFDHAGRPAMLFEPHVFYRILKTRGASAFNAAIAQRLAYPTWGTLPYPPDSYPRLIAACALDEEAALMSASWGVGQLMGENYGRTLCTTVAALVQEAMASGRMQLFQMATFIESAGLADALRNADWPAFARGYNGAGYAADHYDTKLAAYVAAHTAILQPSPPPPTADDLMAAELRAIDAADPHTQT